MLTQKVSRGIAMCLLDGPLTLEEIRAGVENSLFATSMWPGPGRKELRSRRCGVRLSDDLTELVRTGWVVQQEKCFALTPLGRAEAGRAAEEVRTSIDTASRTLRALVQPEAASKVTLVVQVILAVIKLPAGLLSGSVGLLNDSADTILDLLSSLLVYLGIRFDSERLVSILLVVFMLATGGFTLFEAVNRFLVPSVPQVDWFSFVAAALSALAGLALWTYQRYVGLHSGLMAFIAESVDSRNHVIVALGVTAGLAASLLHFSLLDMLVGLAVAVLILWSAVELAVDLVRSSPEKPVDLSHYGFWLQGVYEHGREAYLRGWMLSLIHYHEVRTREELAARIRQAVDLRDNPWLKPAGLDRQLVADPIIEQSLNELFSGGWVADRGALILSERGQEYLKRHGKHKRMWLAAKRNG
jgi:hypothetical protein